jgi:hypothetical protein
VREKELGWETVDVFTSTLEGSANLLFLRSGEFDFAANSFLLKKMICSKINRSMYKRYSRNTTQIKRYDDGSPSFTLTYTGRETDVC